jgi:hypothetical protein
VKITQTISSSVDGNLFNGNQDGGLYIVSDGAVSVAFYQARENDPGSGIIIDATAGIGAVTVTGTSVLNGNLAENANNGIDIVARGNIILSKLDASGNGNLGASLVNVTGPGSISITTGYFNNNNSGLYIRTASTILWKTGSANNNTLFGADINNKLDTLPGKAVTITSVSASSNGSTGLTILTRGAVLLTNVEANNNSINNHWINDSEFWVDNLSPDQDWYFTAADGDTINIQVDSTNFNPVITVTDLNGNVLASQTGTGSTALLTLPLSAADYIIHVQSELGNAGAYHISFYKDGTTPDTIYNESAANGIYIDNHEGAAAPVTLTNTIKSWNSNNSGTNVLILSSGAVSLTNMELDDSRLDGLYVDNVPAAGAPAVVLSKVYLFGNDRLGADIRSYGAVTVKYSEAGGNTGFGVSILNDAGPVMSPITIAYVSLYGNGDDGISLRSRGSVYLNTVSSHDNLGDGIYLITNGSVSFTTVDATRNDGYGAYVNSVGTLTINKSAVDYNNFDDNEKEGLYLVVNGKVSLTRVHASGNGSVSSYAYGIFLNNINSTGVSPVLLTDVITNDNTLTGTRIQTLGAVTVTLLTASENELYGLYIYQRNALDSLKPILLSKIETNMNVMDGVYITGKGAITLSKFVSNDNQGNGINLDNTYGLGAVTILNPAGGLTNNLTRGNDVNGVKIQSNGIVKVTGLETTDNAVEGLDIKNFNSTTNAPVTVTAIYGRNNLEDGLYIHSSGVVTLNSSWFTGNGYNGAWLISDENAFINTSTANGNGWNGFFVQLDPEGVLKLTQSNWFGNLRTSVDINDSNLRFEGALVVML